MLDTPGRFRPNVLAKRGRKASNVSIFSEVRQRVITTTLDKYSLSFLIQLYPRRYLNQD